MEGWKDYTGVLKLKARDCLLLFESVAEAVASTWSNQTVACEVGGPGSLVTDWLFFPVGELRRWVS